MSKIVLPASDKTSSFVKPHIKKGYYPAQLINVEHYVDREGNPIIGKFGKQLIMEFAIYKPDPETSAPVEPMVYEYDKITRDVVIAKFVYCEYKAKDKEGKFIEDEFQTAVTPNSAITKILKALGWEFNAKKGVDVSNLIGAWVEVNIDDYDLKDEKGVASTIVNINEYKGPEVKEDIRKVEKQVNKTVVKQLKHEDVKSDNIDLTGNRLEKAKSLKELLDSKDLTQGGYDKAIESLKEEERKSGNKKG